MQYIRKSGALRTCSLTRKHPLVLVLEFVGLLDRVPHGVALHLRRHLGKERGVRGKLGPVKGYDAKLFI